MKSSEMSVLPDPWIPWWPFDDLQLLSGLNAIASGTLVLANNDAQFLPIVFPCDATLYALRFWGVNASGNYDLGLYDGSLGLLASTGSTALAAGPQTLTLPELRVNGGSIYYAALALSNTLGQIWRPDFGASTRGKGIGLGTLASGLPLPSTAAPGAYGVNVIPFFTFGVR